ncbi:hypothetical protein WN55_09197 [Dufourea novaeangliae]|uniref:Uncharacterized protein n=1 Tax=Dufourea novaeangliae TaxID=178035 RepID=A0A154P8W5_DUFNO|nr:hypothetical protein WN55_09197 [Dufourea novaeangliae]
MVLGSSSLSGDDGSRFVDSVSFLGINMVVELSGTEKGKNLWIVPSVDAEMKAE